MSTPAPSLSWPCIHLVNNPRPQQWVKQAQALLIMLADLGVCKVLVLQLSRKQQLRIMQPSTKSSKESLGSQAEVYYRARAL